MKNMFTKEMVKKSAIFRRVVAVVSALAVVLGVTLNAMPATGAAGITASAAAKDPVKITLYDSSTAPAGDECGSSGKTYSVSSSQLSSWGVDADGLSSCYVIVTYAEAPTSGVIGINANNENGLVDWSPNANFSYTDSISGVTTSTVALSSVGDKAATVIANGLTVQVKSAYVSKIDFNTGSSSENVFTYSAGNISEIEFNAAAMAALEGASGISAQITGTGGGWGFFTEMSSWGSTEGGNPATLTSENEKWDTFAAASGIKITFAGFDSISKVVLTITYPTNAGDGIEINEENFPDEIFRQYVSDNCDTDKNGSLSDDEIAAVKEIHVYTKNISDMTGIEYFTALESLDCSTNNFTTLNVSQNTALTTLLCSENRLTALDVSNNTALKSLYCTRNRLTALDVSQNTALTTLRCYENQLTSLDVSQNTALTTLDCDNNQLVALDISKNTNLTADNVYCAGNKYTVSGCMVDPADLPGSFDLSKASNWTNAKIENGKIISGGTGTATYTYACGNGKSETFSIQFGQHNYVNGTCTRCGSTYAAPTLTISPTTLTVAKGETAEFTVTIDNDDITNYTIMAESSDRNIVAIAGISALVNGKRPVTVEGRAAGTATITVICGKSGAEDITATCEVTVTDGDEGKFEITVNPSEKTIAKGEDFTATVLVTGTTPELQNVDGSMQATYDDTIVSADGGTDTKDGRVYTITGVAAGTTTVKFEWTPNASTGIELERPITVSCEVTVTDGTTPPAAAVTVSPSTATIKVGETAKLTAAVTGKDDAVVTWEANKDQAGDDVVTVAADGTVTGKKAGTVEVWSLVDGERIDSNTSFSVVTVEAGEEPTPPVTGSAIWEGNTDMGTDWIANVQIAANKFADIKAGDTLKFTFTCEPDAQMKIASMAEGWPVIPGPNPDSEWGTINISDTSFSFVLTDADVTALKEYGMAVSGKNYTLTKVELIPKADPKPPVVDPGHEHTPATAWSSDSTGHWHACSGCDEKLSFAAHTSDSGTVTTPATETTSGTRTYKCTVCEYVIRTVTIPPTGEVHTHIFGTEWKYSDTRHWHECTVCGDKSDHAAHTEDSGTVTKAPTETETGVKTYKCKVCGYVLRTEVIPATGGGSGNTSRPDDTSKPDDTSEPDDIGNIYKDAQAGDNVPNAEIVTPTNTLAEAALTPEERESVKNGENIGIVLKLEDGTAIVSDKDKAAVEAALNGSENLKLAQYLEINLYKIVGGVETEITQTNEPITIKISVPEALRGSGREFVLIRVHDGETVLLPDSDNDENTVTVETDRFSVYALAYRENVSADTPGENPNTGVAPTGTYLIVIGSVMLFIILFLTLFTGRNGMSEERKERVFASLIAWGKRGGKLRALIALAVIFLLLSFYYGIGMKTAER